MARTPAERQRAYRERKKRGTGIAAVVDIRTAGNAAPKLGDAGQRLWNDVTSEWDIAEHERAVLIQACRAADRLDAMAGELAAAPLTVENHRGDMIPHPLLCESRQTAALLARLCAALGLPTGDQDAAGRRTTSRRGHRGYYNLTPGA